MPLEYAALPKRGAAFLIDALTLAPLAMLGRESLPVAALCAAGFWAACEASPWQASAGKRIARLRTIRADGGRVTWGRAVWRSAVKGLPLLLWAWWPWAAAAAAVLTLIGMVFDRRRRSLPDLLAGTAVIVLPPATRRN